MAWSFQDEEVRHYRVDKMADITITEEERDGEEIYQALPHESESIMISEYPKACDALVFTADAENMTKIIDAIKAIRTRRSEMNVPPSKKAKVYLATKYADIFASAEAFFTRLASASELVIQADKEVICEGTVSVVLPFATAFIPLADLLDVKAEIERLNKEKKRLEGELKRSAGMLRNAYNAVARYMAPVSK